MRRPRSRYGSRVVSSEGYRWRRLNPMTEATPEQIVAFMLGVQMPDKFEDLRTLICDQAAEIERLRADNALLQGALGIQTDLVMKREAEIKRLRAALQGIADDGKNCQDYCRSRACRALEPKP